MSSTLVQIVKNPLANVGDLGPIPGLGRSSGGGHGNPLQYSCLENPMDRRAWHSTVHRVTRVRHDLAIKLPPYPVIRPFVKIAHINYTIS